MGIRSRRSPAASSSSGRPAPSLPNRIASGCGRAVSHTEYGPDPDVTTTEIPCSRDQRKNSADVATAETGNLNNAPHESLTAARNHRSYQQPDHIPTATPAP